MRLTVAIMVQFPDSSSIMLCHQDLPQGRDILWEIKSVLWHKKVALGSLPGLLRSYAPKYRRTMHMAWVLSAHCPAPSLSLGHFLFLCLQAMGLWSLQQSRGGWPWALQRAAESCCRFSHCTLLRHVPPVSGLHGTGSLQLSTHCHYGNTWCCDMGGDNIPQIWGLLDGEDTKTLFINIKQRK